MVSYVNFPFQVQRCVATQQHAIALVGNEQCANTRRYLPRVEFALAELVGPVRRGDAVRRARHGVLVDS